MKGIEHMKMRLKKGKQKLMATLATLHRLRNLKLTVKSTIIQACILSVIGYGSEGCYVPEACAQLVPKLDILQRYAARMLLQTPQSTANETCTLDLNWQTVQTQMDIRLIKFRTRIA